MICPLSSCSVALRSPFTITVDVTLPGALATEQVHHPPEHSRELDARLLVGAHVGANRRRAQYACRQSESNERANSIMSAPAPSPGWRRLYSCEQPRDDHERGRPHQREAAEAQAFEQEPAERGTAEQPGAHARL